MPSISRWSQELLSKGLSFQRIAFIAGGRRCGKTTLARDLCPIKAKYRTLDENETLSAALSDPRFFLHQADKNCLIIDDIQKVPLLINEIKQLVDANNQPGQFILTGSADYRKLPFSIDADSLTGRMMTLRLRTMTQAEILGKKAQFLKNGFEDNFPTGAEIEPCGNESIYQLAIRGGYPETLDFDSKERSHYFQINFLPELRKDLANLWGLKRYRNFENLLHTLALYSSEPLNIQSIRRELSGNAITINSYLDALKALYLIDEVPAWESKELKIGSKTSKIFISDSALMAHLLNIRTPNELFSNLKKMLTEGRKLVKTWAYSQLIPEVELHPLWKIYHFNNRNRQTIDFLISDDKNRFLGIQIKAAETILADDFKHIKWFSNQVKDFRGIILYAGRRLFRFGPGFYAVPFSALWA